MEDHERGAPAIGRRALLILGATAAVSACAPSTTARTSDDAGAGPAGPTTSGSRPETSPSSTVAGSDGPATEVVHGPRSVPKVALTFHGQGDPALAVQILEAVAREKAAITVLAVGTWLEQHPAMARAVLDAGHELGNHTLHHRPMGEMSESAAYAEILGGQRAVRRFTALPQWFRPSGTPHATPQILAAAGRAGYRTSLSFDVDPADYADPGSDAVVARVLRDVRPGSIVSLHLGHAGTVTALPAVLAGLTSRGLTPVTVSELLVGVTP